MVFKEEFKDALKKKDQYFEIYKNPNHDELIDMYRDMIISIRYIYDKKKEDLYVFSAELLHAFAADKLNIKYSDFSEDYIFGQGRITTNGRIIDFFLLRGGLKGFYKGTKVEHLFLDKE